MAKKVGVMEPIPFEHGRLAGFFLDADCVFVQPKLKGARLRWDGHELFTSTGNVVVGLPHIVATLRRRFPLLPLDGEAYCHGMSEGKLIAATTAAEPLAYADQIKFHIFEMIITGRRQSERLVQPFAFDGALDTVPTSTCYGPRQVTAHLEAALHSGFEGIIVRHPRGEYTPGRTWQIMKWKPGGQDAYTIVRLFVDFGAEYFGAAPAAEGRFRVVGLDGKEFNVSAASMEPEAWDEAWARRHDLPGKKLAIDYCGISEGVPAGAVFRAFVAAGK